MVALSYRRDDSVAIAGRLYDRLQSSFGKQQVFMDFDSIPAGVDFRQHITQTIEDADVVLALIGSRWLGVQSDSRRIDDPSDFVRLEISSALQRGIPVVPVLLSGTEMPKPEELPLDLRELAFRNALPLDSGRDFHTHAQRIIASVREISTRPGHLPLRQRPIVKLGLTVLGLGLLVAAVLGVFRFLVGSPEPRLPNEAASLVPSPSVPQIGINQTVESSLPSPKAQDSASPLSQRLPASARTPSLLLADFLGRWVSTALQPIPGGGSLTTRDTLVIEDNSIDETITTEWLAENIVAFRVTVHVRFADLHLYGNQLNTRCTSAEVMDVFDPKEFGKIANIADQTTKAAQQGVNLRFVWTLTGTELRRGETAWEKETQIGNKTSTVVPYITSLTPTETARR